MRVLFVIFAIYFSSWAEAYTVQPEHEEGAFFVRSYSPKSYLASPQNWAVVQDRQGVIYVGNTEGLLEFDGQRWQTMKLPNSVTVRSLAVDAKGTVYVGAQSEFGYLKPNGSGALEYVSLVDRLDPQDRNFKDIWTTSATRAGVVFSSYQKLFRWSPQTGLKIWKPLSTFSTAFTVDDVPYLVDKARGLCRLTGDALERVRGGELFEHTAALRGVFRFRGALMAATADALYVQDGDTFREFDTEARTVLRASGIYRCLPLGDETLAIGTIQGGTILLDAHGKIWRTLDSRALGLRSNSINGMYRDREGGLWLASENGLARVDMGGAVTQFGRNEGLEEIVNSIRRYDSALYAGTMAGLSRLVTGPDEKARFERVEGVQGEVLALATTTRGLLVAWSGGLYELTRDRLDVVLQQGAIRDLALSINDQSVVYAAGRHGLFVLQAEGGKWGLVKYVDAGGDEFLSVAEETDGVVWLTTHSDVRRLDLRTAPVQVERFSKEHGLPPGWNHAYRIDGSVFFATEKGLFRYLPNKRTFVEAGRLMGHVIPSDSRPVSVIAETSRGDTWISGASYHRVMRPANSKLGTLEENALGNFGIQELYAFYADPDGTIWAAGIDGGLIRYKPSIEGTNRVELRTLVRRLQIARQERTVFGGAVPPTFTPKLRYGENAIHFDFAAPLFEGVSETEFRVLLEGLERSWSNWMPRAEKEYTNLWEGSYVMHVQARDLTGRISRDTTFAFRVLPPLYRRWWAYLVYFVLVLTASWLIFQWRLLTIRAQNRKLEAIISDRTEEIRQQRDEIKAQEQETERLLLNILPASVAKELRATGAVAPLLCDNITVCFTDFVKFTLSTETIPASELVLALNRYFSEFDRIIDRHGLEKVKTIGDSYMFVGGLPKPKVSHAVDAVLAALEIVAAVERFGCEAPGWQIRIGVHSGPVVAGVVGLRKFAFDIWGGTVNLASRHESSGQPNCVNVSVETYKLVSEFFQCQSRGEIVTKEGRALEMYLVRCIHPDLCGPGATEKRSFENLYKQKFHSSADALAGS